MRSRPSSRIEAGLDALAGKTVVVTGASGFVGGALVRQLTAVGCSIIRVSRRRLAPAPAPTSAVVTDVQADVTDRACWDRIGGADVIFHCAAQTSWAIAESDPEQNFRSTVLPMRFLVDSCRERRHRPIVVFAATATQTGVASRLPVNEDVPDRPLTVYCRHKLIAEGDLKIAAAEGVVRGVSLRLPNLYGPGARAASDDRDVVNRAIRAAMRGEALTVYGSGNYLRDYLFIDDAIDAFVAAATCAELLLGRHFVVATGQPRTVGDAFAAIATRVAAKCGHPVTVTTDPARALAAIDQRHFVGDASRFMAATGWRPAWQFEDGIDRTIEAYRCGS